MWYNQNVLLIKIFYFNKMKTLLAFLLTLTSSATSSKDCYVAMQENLGMKPDNSLLPCMGINHALKFGNAEEKKSARASAHDIRELKGQILDARKKGEHLNEARLFARRMLDCFHGDHPEKSVIFGQRDDFSPESQKLSDVVPDGISAAVCCVSPRGWKGKKAPWEHHFFVLKRDGSIVHDFDAKNFPIEAIPEQFRSKIKDGTYKIRPYPLSSDTPINKQELYYIEDNSGNIVYSEPSTFLECQSMRVRKLQDRQKYENSKEL